MLYILDVTNVHVHYNYAKLDRLTPSWRQFKGNVWSYLLFPILAPVNNRFIRQHNRFGRRSELFIQH